MPRLPPSLSLKDVPPEITPGNWKISTVEIETVRLKGNFTKCLDGPDPSFLIIGLWVKCASSMLDYKSHQPIRPSSEKEYIPDGLISLLFGSVRILDVAHRPIVTKITARGVPILNRKNTKRALYPAINGRFAKFAMRRYT